MKPSAEKVLALLRSGPQTTGSFARQFCPRASARILELRKAGYEVRTIQLGQSSFRYELISEPNDAEVGGKEPPPSAPAAADLGAEPTLFELPERRWVDAA